jgi:hypothetical protein
MRGNRVALLTTLALLLLLIIIEVLARGWLNRMLAVFARAAWAVAVVRLLGVRATMPERILVIALLLGALLSVAVAPILPKLPNPYGDRGVIFDLLAALARQGALLAPVLVLMFASRLQRAASLADTFLLAFMVGFGYDLIGAILTVNHTRPTGYPLFWPPFQIPDTRGVLAAAGYAYWTALVAVTLHATLRFRASIANFTRVPARWSGFIPVGLTVLVFLWVAVEHVAPFAPNAGVWIKLKAWFDGRGTAVLALCVLVVLSWVEALWITRATASPAPTIAGALADLQGVVGAARWGGWRALEHALVTRKLRRQADVVRAELALAPHDQDLQRYASALDGKLREAASHEGRTDAARPSVPSAARDWQTPAAIAGAGWVAFVFFAFLLPKIPRAQAAFWQLPGVVAVLAAIVVWRYITAPARPAGDDPGAMLGFTTEQTLLQVAMGLGVALLVFPPMGATPFPGLLSAWWGIALPPVGKALLAFLAIAATGTVLATGARWRVVAPSVRRAAAVRRALVVASAVVLLWLPQVIYPQNVVQLHAQLGPPLKATFVRRYGDNSAAGYATSTTLAYAAALLTGLVCGVSAVLLHAAVRQLERLAAYLSPRERGAG